MSLSKVYAAFAGMMALLVFSSAPVQAQPVRVVPLSEIQTGGILRDQIVDYENNWGIVRTPLFYQQGQNLFVVTLAGLRSEGLHETLSMYGHVVHLQQGEFAVMQIHEPSLLDALSFNLHRLTGGCGLIRFIDGVTIPHVALAAAYPLERPHHGLNFNSQGIPELLAQIDVVNLQRTVAELESWGTRHHTHETGRLAGDRIAQMYRQLIPPGRSDVGVHLFDHSRSPQKSVIVRIPGKSLYHEVIVLGSHLDSINPSQRSQYAPGADDNATGTATNLEIFRVLMANGIQPERTIEIHAYAAEEVGLVGSMEIANTYRKNQVRVHAMIQFDMNGYSRNGFDRVYLVSNKTNRDLTAQLGYLTETYLGLPWTAAPLWAGSSDHASWHKYGYPAAFPFEEPGRHNPHIHTSNDTVQNINSWPMVRAYSQLGLAYVLTHGVGY